MCVEISREREDDFDIKIVLLARTPQIIAAVVSSQLAKVTARWEKSLKLVAELEMPGDTRRN